MQKQKVELNAKAVKMYIDLHIKIGLPFEITLTNYTQHLKSARYDIQFMKNAQSNRVFVAYQMIKKDIAGKPVQDINATTLRYYQSNFNFTEIYADKIFNVDLKSAYATILHNDGYISDLTAAYLGTLPKLDRLAAVGMLAGRKNTFQFDNTGKIISSFEKVSETANYFFHAVLRTFEIMGELKKEIGNDFLFSWVDGIYFGSETNGEKLQAILREQHNFSSSFDTLTEFEIKRLKSHYSLSYLKDGEKKLFNIPLPDNTARQELYNYLLTKKYNQEPHENGNLSL